jgi:sugar phosphate isomerase/epimerase
MTYPRIHLALDNCFASKRWTMPAEWMALAETWGITCIEASADNECDPLYSPPDVLGDWLNEVKAAAEKTGTHVANLYSGHGSYATLGLAHPDPRVRDHMQHRWLEPMIDMAAKLGAGLGFYCHAFSQATLRTPRAYHSAMDDLCMRLSQLAAYARAAGMNSPIGVEQMYSPHQPPWTIDGARGLLREVYERGGNPFYLTLDTGHAVGQHNFLRPDADEVAALYGRQGDLGDVWLGGLAASAFDSSGLARALSERDYMFATKRDGDAYAWIEALAPYAPIIHLQQTDGTASGHRPFTARYNATGIIEPKRVLAAIKAAYDAPAPPNMPPPVADIYLTLEVFAGTAQRYEHIRDDLRESAAYWRAAVPHDGVTVDQLV